MLMKTKHVKNTGQVVRRGKIGKLPGGGCKGGKLPGGANGKNCQGRANKAKNCSGGHCPFCPIAIVRP